VSSHSEWPIVVGGCLRSGTSLVRRILDSHPRVHCGPEIKFFRDFYGDYRDDPLEHLRFATTVRDLVSEEEALDVLGRAFVELHERAARRARKPRWADKAPENVLYTRQWDRLLDERWLFVHVVRNPLDTVASMHGRFPLTLPEDVPARTHLYRTYTQAGLVFEEAHPERSLRIVYEELCAAPEEGVKRLMVWLGETFDPAQLAFNELPHETGLEDPEIASTNGVHGGSVGRWRSVLSDDEAALVWARTRDLWDVIDPAGRHSAAHAPGD
jgi:Sulfotransferase family